MRPLVSIYVITTKQTKPNQKTKTKSTHTKTHDNWNKNTQTPPSVPTLLTYYSPPPSPLLPQCNNQLSAKQTKICKKIKNQFNSIWHKNTSALSYTKRKRFSNYFWFSMKDTKFAHLHIAAPKLIRFSLSVDAFHQMLSLWFHVAISYDHQFIVFFLLFLMLN